MTAESPPPNTLPKATMTDVRLHYLTLRLEQELTETDEIRWTATETGVDIEGHGRTAPQAIADYAARVGDFQPPNRAPKRTNAEVVDPAEVADDE
jgi:hypothetical protein